MSKYQEAKLSGAANEPLVYWRPSRAWGGGDLGAAQETNPPRTTNNPLAYRQAEIPIRRVQRTIRWRMGWPKRPIRHAQGTVPFFLTMSENGTVGDGAIFSKNTITV